MTGIWLFAVAGAAPALRLSPSASAVCVWSLAVSGYTFSIAAAVAALLGVRGLEPTGPAANLAVYVGFTVGAVSSVVGLGVILVGVVRGLRSTAVHQVERKQG